MKTTRTFRTGNSVAVRLPKSLGVEAGVEVTVREERGRYVVEPLPKRTDRIDLTGIYGACPGLKPAERLDISPRELDAGGKLLKRG